MGYTANEYMKFTPRCMMAIFNLCADLLINANTHRISDIRAMIQLQNQLNFFHFEN